MSIRGGFVLMSSSEGGGHMHLRSSFEGAFVLEHIRGAFVHMS